MSAFEGIDKQALLEMAEKHRLADEYIKGSYGEEDGNGIFRGCSVGCTIKDVCKLKGIEIDVNDHAALAVAIGVPEFIIHLQDRIFENLPEPLNSEWTERLFNAIPDGATKKQLDSVLPKFLLKTLDRLPETDRRDVVESVQGVRDVLKNWLDTGEPDKSAAEAAEAEAEAAWAAARAAWEAAEAAREAAEAAAEAAWAAARAARVSAREAAGESPEIAAWVIVGVAAKAAARAAEAAAEAAWAAAEVSAGAAWEQISQDLIDCFEGCAE